MKVLLWVCPFQTSAIPLDILIFKKRKTKKEENIWTKHHNCTLVSALVWFQKWNVLQVSSVFVWFSCLYYWSACWIEFPGYACISSESCLNDPILMVCWCAHSVTVAANNTCSSIHWNHSQGSFWCDTWMAWVFNFSLGKRI